MTASRYDVVAARTYTDRFGAEKTQYTRLGVAFPFKEKEGFTVQLDAIPAPVDGVYRLLLMVPRPRDQAKNGFGQSPMYEDSVVDEKLIDRIDDEIPF